jgi:Class III cytochrome C family
MKAGGRWFMRLVIAASLAGATGSYATSVETLLMPGKVANAHAKLEEVCRNCHDRTNRVRQSELCLACHKPIAADVRAHTGYHGRMPNASAGKCVGCHTEHQGRGGDIVRLDRATFDHALTNFPLVGAHRTLDCLACHKAGEAFRKADASCIACHKKDDYHGGQLGTKCAECHSNDNWTGGHFDHSKTKFSLTGAHQSVSCGGCHLGGQYKSAPKTCVGCHATDDVHHGERGSECGKCHATSDWKTAKFDHEKETGFALLGRHAKIDCVGCHRSGNFKDKIPKDCYGCHKADDSHAGRFGQKCNDCHDNLVWQPVKYDHLARTKFALVGVHAKLDCHTCHTANAAQQKLATDCIGCHRAANPHGLKFKTSCDSCHGQQDWHSEISFDHDLTSFPLLGLHNVVSCAQCHRTQAFSDAKARCIDCHKKDDVHKGGLGEKCDTCHSPNGWALWVFDHFKQTGFALSGAHGKLKCADCHRKPAGEVKISPDCISCHQKDDIHAGQFGRQCQRCHSTVTFKGGRAR